MVKELHFNESCYDSKSSDFAALLYSLNFYNWQATFKNLNINEATSKFYSILNSFINICVPKCTRKIFNFSHWYSKTLCKNILVSTINDLDVIFLANLLFNNHIDVICSK